MPFGLYPFASNTAIQTTTRRSFWSLTFFKVGAQGMFFWTKLINKCSLSFPGASASTLQAILTVVTSDKGSWSWKRHLNLVQAGLVGPLVIQTYLSFILKFICNICFHHYLRLGWAKSINQILDLRLFRCSLNLLSSSSISLGCSLALVSSVYFGPKHCYVLRPWQFLDKTLLFIRFFPKSQKTTILILQTEILKYFDNEREQKFRPKRDFDRAHVQLVGCHWPKVQLPRACLGKATLIMGGRRCEGNHLCKLLTSSDETRKKPLDVSSLEYLFAVAPNFCTTAQGVCHSQMISSTWWSRTFRTLFILRVRV